MNVASTVLPLVAPEPILSPARGQVVWIQSNGEPSDRFFVEFHAGGVRLAKDFGLEQVNYFDHLRSGMYRSRADVLTLQCMRLRDRLAATEAELTRRLAQLQGEIA
ncbi:hypothetical protein ABIC83_002398 [Roseateles asaccharophilus]|uniref:hypothetical protein n=1 Tax=Roseateles asaccharophilus TaxID=582607 RepID=UPI00383768E9